MRVRHLIVATLIASTSFASTAAPVAEAASVPYPIRNIPLPPDSAFVSLAPGARFASYFPGNGLDQNRIDLATGLSTTIVPDQPYMSLDDGGRFAWARGTDNELLLRDLNTASTTTHDPFGATDWFPDSVADIDAAGRYVLIDAANGSLALGRTFLYDATLRQLVTPEPVGLSTGTNQSSGVSISDDGRFVSYAEVVTGGAPTEQFVQWDRQTDQRLVVPRPAQHDLAVGGWTISPDFQWILFPASVAGVVPGLDATSRLYRRNRASGATDVVPADIARLSEFAVTNGGGRVIFTENRVSRLDPAFVLPQLLTWDGAGPANLITTGVDGLAADGGVFRWAFSDDGTLISFTSFASNLPPARSGLDPERLFQVTLPAIGSVNAAAVVAAGERYCVAAVGADPGDFVGINITPVLATAPGFGTLHSSDDPAGSTSNVNFGPNTVDPNVAFAKVGADGQICFTNGPLGPVHVILDEMIVADATAFRSPTPTGSTRLVNTREGLGGTIVQPAETRCVAAVGAQPGEFVGVNVLPVDATGPGFGTIHPSGSPAGSSSTANYTRGSFDPNFAFTKVGPDGQICFTNAPFGPVHLILDELIVGTSTVMRTPTPGPTSDRPVDTRTGIGGNRLQPSGTLCFAIPGSNPADVGFVNILAVDAAGPGFATVHSSSDSPGSTSNANYAANSFDPNMGIASFGPDNRMCLTNGPISATDVIIDSQVIATGTAFTKPTPAGTVRLVDTRIARA